MHRYYRLVTDDEITALSRALLGADCRAGYDVIRDELVERVGYSAFSIAQRVAVLVASTTCSVKAARQLICEQDIQNGAVQDLPVSYVRILRRGEQVTGLERTGALRALAGDYTLEYRTEGGLFLPITVEQLSTAALHYLLAKEEQQQ